MSEDSPADVTSLTVQLLSAYLSNNTVESGDLAGLIATTRAALSAPAEAPASVPAESFEPAVSVRKSLSSRDHILSLIDGKPYKMLKRHLLGHGLTPAEYRARYNLASDYPMVAPAYSDQRRDVAKHLGLGRKSMQDTLEPPLVSEAADTSADDTTSTKPAPTKPTAKPRTPKATTKSAPTSAADAATLPAIAPVTSVESDTPDAPATDIGQAKPQAAGKATGAPKARRKTSKPAAVSAAEDETTAASLPEIAGDDTAQSEAVAPVSTKKAGRKADPKSKVAAKTAKLAPPTLDDGATAPARKSRKAKSVPDAAPAPTPDSAVDAAAQGDTPASPTSRPARKSKTAAAAATADTVSTQAPARPAAKRAPKAKADKAPSDQAAKPVRAKRMARAPKPDGEAPVEAGTEATTASA